MPSGNVDRRSFLTVAGAAAAAFALPALTGNAQASAATRSALMPTFGSSVPGLGVTEAQAAAAVAGWDSQAILQAVVDMRFGMFNHFNLGTFTDEEWAAPNQSPMTFAPPSVDTDQWADAALAAGMTYGVLTTKHHDGFALWPTKYGSQNVMNSGYRQDVVAQYCESFRSRGLKVGLYFSVWDRTHPVRATGGFHVSDQTAGVEPAQIEYVLNQLTELLTNYGPIEVLMTDGYGWQMGQQQVPYQQVRDLVKSLQPNCVMIDLGALLVPWLGDAIFFEEPFGITAPPGNTNAGMQGQTISQGWFWHPSTPTESLMSRNDILTHLNDLENRWTTFILNCPPNRQGRLDDNVVARLAEVGAAWSTPAGRGALPPQTLRVEYPVTPVAAYASGFHQGEGAYLAIDGRSDNNFETCWSTWPGTGALALPQSVTIDLGGVYDNLTTLSYLPKQWKRTNSTDGDITGYEISTSVDGAVFGKVTEGAWAADQTLKVAEWPAVSAGFVRLTAKTATGGYSNVNGVVVGGRTAKPTRTSFTVTPDRPYRIVNRRSGKVLTVTGAGTADGTAVVQAADTGASNQRWTISTRDNGYVVLQDGKSGKVLEIGGRSRAVGARAGIWTDVRVLQQQWAITRIADGQAILTNRFSTHALAVVGASTDEGAAGEQQVYTGADHQQWALVDASAEAASTATATLTSADTPTADGWYTADVQVAFAAPTGTAVQYRLDGGSWRTYTTAFAVTTNAAHVLDHRLTHNGSVVPNSAATLSIRIDKTVPTVSAVMSPSTGTGTPRNPVTITFGGTDALSDLDRVEYQINQSAWTPVEVGTPLTVATVGTHLVAYRSLDVAGNVSVTKTNTIRIGSNAATSIKASSRSVAVGGYVTFTLAGFERYDMVSLSLRDLPLVTVATDVTGAARSTVRIPVGTAPGPVTVTARGSDGDPSASTSLTLT